MSAWLRYWVVVSCATLPEMVLDRLTGVPHVNTLVSMWCLLPGPLSGSELIFPQVSLLSSGLKCLMENTPDISVVQVLP